MTVDPNNPDPTTNVNKFSIDLSWKTFPVTAPPAGVPPGTPPPVTQLPGQNQDIYTLPAGATYAWPADIPLFARITPIQNPNGNTVPIWVQPQGVGQSSPFTTSTVQPLPLPAQLDITGSAGGSPSNPLFVQTAPIALSAQEFSPANPQVGKSAGYILPADGIIKIITGNLICGAEVNTRLIYYQVLYGPTGVLPYQFIIGQTTQSISFVGALGIENGILGNVINFRLPNVLLPSGSKIAMNIVGINPDDYIDDLDFVIAVT